MKYLLLLVLGLSSALWAEELTDKELALKEMREQGLTTSRPYTLDEVKVHVVDTQAQPVVKVVAVSGIDMSDKEAALREMYASGASVSRPYRMGPPGQNNSTGIR